MIKKKLKLDLPDEILNKIEEFYNNETFIQKKKKFLKLYNPIINYMIYSINNTNILTMYILRHQSSYTYTDKCFRCMTDIINFNHLNYYLYKSNILIFINPTYYNHYHQLALTTSTIILSWA